MAWEPRSRSVLLAGTPIGRRYTGGKPDKVTGLLRYCYGAVRGDLEPEGAAPVGHACDAHPSAVQLDRVLHDGESKAGTSGRAGAAAVDAIESLEDAGQVLRRYAAPRIGDRDA